MLSRRVATVALLVFALPAWAHAADELILIPRSTVDAPGGRLRGTIQSESPTAVKIQAATGAVDVPVDQIDSITYDGQPQTLLRAQTIEAGNDLPNAIELYKKAAADAAGKPFIVQAAAFGEAHALAELALGNPGRANDAITKLEAFLSTHPKSRHQGPVLESLARLTLQKGDVDRAEKAVNELADLPWAADRATLLRARVLVKRNKGDAALKELDKVIAEAPKGSTRATEAKLARGETLASLKRYDDAQAAIKDVIKETPPEKADVQALAYNTLGDCLRAAGRPKDALFAYLQTVIVYDKEKEQLPRTLYQSAQIFRELKRDDRADELMDELRQKFPQSPYLSGRAK